MPEKRYWFSFAFAVLCVHFALFAVKVFVLPQRNADSICKLTQYSKTIAVSFWKGYRYTLPMSEQTCEPVPPPTADKDLPQELPGGPGDLLDPYEKLVSIEVLGKQVEVPEKNRLLRCFQFLSLRTISYGDFCWNGDCTNCQIWYHTGDQANENDKPGLSCRMEVIEGMKITSMSPFIKIKGITK